MGTVGARVLGATLTAGGGGSLNKYPPCVLSISTAAEWLELNQREGNCFLLAGTPAQSIIV